MDELEKKGTIYDAFDETKTRLRSYGISKLMRIFDMLTDDSNTIIIEHNLIIVSFKDWIIDFNPSEGSDSRHILFDGNPKYIVNCNSSRTRTYFGIYIIENIARFGDDTKVLIACDVSGSM